MKSKNHLTSEITTFKVSTNELLADAKTLHERTCIHSQALLVHYLEKYWTFAKRKMTWTAIKTENH